MYTPVTFLPRATQKEVTIDGIVIPKVRKRDASQVNVQYRRSCRFLSQFRGDRAYGRYEKHENEITCYTEHKKKVVYAYMHVSDRI